MKRWKQQLPFCIKTGWFGISEWTIYRLHKTDAKPNICFYEMCIGTRFVTYNLSLIPWYSRCIYYNGFLQQFCLSIYTSSITSDLKLDWGCSLRSPYNLHLPGWENRYTDTQGEQWKSHELRLSNFASSLTSF